MNRAEEDYIKVIYELSRDRNDILVKTTALSKHFAITDQSVNEMVKKLSGKELLEFIPYKGVRLTELGLKEAIRLVRAHLIWEVFLSEKLKLPRQELHEEAEKLEHVASTKVVDKLYIYLGCPKFCAHGNPIPTKEGKIAIYDNKLLIDFEVGNQVVIQRVLDDKEVLIYLDEENIRVNDTFVVVEKSSDEIVISNATGVKRVPQKIARYIYGIFFI